MVSVKKSFLKFDDSKLDNLLATYETKIYNSVNTKSILGPMYFSYVIPEVRFDLDDKGNIDALIVISYQGVKDGLRNYPLALERVLKSRYMLELLRALSSFKKYNQLALSHVLIPNRWETKQRVGSVHLYNGIKILPTHAIGYIDPIIKLRENLSSFNKEEEEEVNLDKLVGLLRDAGIGEDILIIEPGDDEFVMGIEE